MSPIIWMMCLLLSGSFASQNAPYVFKCCGRNLYYDTNVFKCMPLKFRPTDESMTAMVQIKDLPTVLMKVSVLSHGLPDLSLDSMIKVIF